VASVKRYVYRVMRLVILGGSGNWSRLRVGDEVWLLFVVVVGVN